MTYTYCCLRIRGRSHTTRAIRQAERRLARVEAQLRVYTILWTTVALLVMLTVMLYLHDCLDPLALIPWDDVM